MNTQQTYQLIAGGLVWTIDLHLSEKVTLKQDGKEFQMPAFRVASSKGSWLVVEYRKWEWREHHRPFDFDCHIAFTSMLKRHVVRAACLSDVLWSLATGRDPRQLDVSTTATLVDEPPKPRAGHTQPHRAEPGVTRESPRQSVGERLSKALQFIERHDGGSHSERRGR